MKLNRIESGTDHGTAPDDELQVQGHEAPPPAPVVLIHGLFGQARNLGRLQRRLARTRRVVAMDLRSHGDSPHGPLDPRAMADDIAETMADAGLERAVLIGHSLGGKVAMATALAHPDRVMRLLVADIAPVAYEHGNRAYTTAMQALSLVPGVTRADADVALSAAISDRAVRNLLLQNANFGDTPGWRIGLDDIAASLTQAEGWPEWPDATAYQGRTMFVRAEHSDFVLSEHIDAIRRFFPKASMVTLHDAGHWLHVDRPEEFFDIASSFVAGADNPHATASQAVNA